MTIAVDGRFLLNGSVHPHSRLVHILLRRNRLEPYPATFVLCTDRPPDPVVFDRDYASANVSVEIFGPTGSRLRRLRWLWAGLPAALRRRDASVFYSSFYFLPGRCAGVRLVNSIHDCCVFYIDPALNRGLLSSPSYLRVLKQVMKWTNRRAHATVTVSNFSKLMLVRHLGLAPEQVRVCYHGLEARAARGRARPAAAGPKPYFLFVGSNLPKKNIRQCLAGFARLPGAVRSGFNLCLRTAPYPEDRRQIAELGIADEVVFIPGHQGEDEMADLYAGASLLLLLSYDEGFGLPIIEAFAAGVPVLVSDRAACGELVAMAECKADPDDTAGIAAKWLALATDPGLRSRCLGSQAALLAQFELRRTADAFYGSLTA